MDSKSTPTASELLIAKKAINEIKYPDHFIDLGKAVGEPDSIYGLYLNRNKCRRTCGSLF